uniref:CCHC-type domain-containing protein n=1 Tax=Cannabis sativa TaxID=3483 RepID=A0A803NGW9_CANSA
MVIVNEMASEEVTVAVDVRDDSIAKTLERDSAMEIEMMELFEDLSLEDIMVNKACVGKVMGCKNMAASVVRKILLGIWNLEETWRMKKFEDGVQGFFFESEADCAFVLNKRPWLVNGVLLNLKSFPIEGEVRVSEFDLARFWVEFHGLPTCCLSENNIPTLAKKSGSNPEVLIQFKYEKLPYLCFNCGKLAHTNRECLAPTTWVTPPSGKAVRMYGPWIKTDGPSGNCFSAVAFRSDVIHAEEGVKLSGANHRSKGSWRRRPLSIQSKKGEGSSKAAAVAERPAIAGEGTSVGTLHGTMHGTVHGGGRPWSTKLDDVAQNVGMQVVPGVECLDIPNIWACKSQVAHHFPEPTNFKWPSNDPNLQKLYCELLGPDYTNMYKAQPSLISNPPNVSKMIIHLLGSKKRKAHTWYQPIPKKFLDSLFEDESRSPVETNVTTAPEIDKLKDSNGRDVEIQPFNPGRSDGPTKGRRKKGLRAASSSALKKNLGVKTRRRKKLIREANEGNPINLDQVLAQCVDVPITYVQNFGNGEEAARAMAPPLP